MSMLSAVVDAQAPTETSGALLGVHVSQVVSTRSIPASSLSAAMDQSTSKLDELNAKPVSSEKPCTRIRVALPPRMFDAGWVLVALLHTWCGAAYVLHAWLYFFFPHTLTASVVPMEKVAIQLSAFKAVGSIHALIALVHVRALGLMITNSMRSKQLVFYSHKSSRYPVIPDRARLSLPTMPKLAGSRLQTRTTQCAICQLFFALLSRLMKFWSGLCTVFSVDYDHFEFVFVFRQLCQVSLQIFQGVLQSLLITRYWLGNMMASLIIVSCWSSPIATAIVGRYNEAHKRLVLLSFQIALDCFTMTIVPLTLVSAYARIWDPSLHDFERGYYYNVFWRTNMLAEFKFFWVQSWLNLFIRVFLALNLASGIEICKAMIERKTTSVPTSQDQEKREPSAARFQPQQRGRRRRLALTCMHYFFGILGVAVLAIHCYAASRPMLSMCGMQVRPWLLRPKPACAAYRLDCRYAGLNNSASEGANEEITVHLNSIDEQMLVTLKIVHCPGLQIPPAIQQFRHMSTLSIFNSTIRSWDVDASISTLSHPGMVILQLIRVRNISTLPVGLLSPTFISPLIDVEFADSDLRTFPPDIAIAWPHIRSIFVESSNLTAWTFVHENLRLVTMSENDVPEFPDHVLRSPILTAINICGNKRIGALPVDANIKVPLMVHAEDTNISSIPKWVNDDFFALGNSQFNVAGTPLCTSPPRDQVMHPKVNCKRIPMIKHSWLSLPLLDTLGQAKTGAELMSMKLTTS